MIEELKKLERRFLELQKRIVEPDVMANHALYAEVNREYRHLEKIVKVYQSYNHALEDIDEVQRALEDEKDEEFREFLNSELERLGPQRDGYYQELKVQMLPRDTRDDENAILEIRAGTGGDEAALFAGDLFSMYMQYAQKCNWKFSVLSATEGAFGGYKEIISMVEGDQAYGHLKFESGVHRVQRVPSTESMGRIHTSAATVAVLAHVEDVDVQVNMEDVRRDTFRASGAGGQHVNKTDSAIRLTHRPTGIVVECQDGRSQHANFDKALKVLKSRIYDLEKSKREQEMREERRGQVKSGDRSDKIRTYNFPRGTVTDHRVGYSNHNISVVLGGNIQPFIDRLKIDSNSKKILGFSSAK